MDGPIREAPDMATFVDTVSDHATERVRALVTELSTTIAELEHADDPHYTKAIRFLLAGTAALMHGVTLLAEAKKDKHAEWSERQRDAIAFLEVRTTECGREFVVAKQGPEISRGRWPGLPPVGKRFRFTLERVAALGGGPFGRRAAIEVWTSFDGYSTYQPHGPMTLQALHRAFLDKAIVDAAPEGEREDLFSTIEPESTASPTSRYSAAPLEPIGDIGRRLLEKEGDRG